MTAATINSEVSLQSTIGMLREDYALHHFLRVKWSTGKDRSLDQNALSHLFYDQLARELREDDALGWKCYCKLTIGVPILRAEDEAFRGFYDGAIKGLTYEQKLSAMQFVPITSIMTVQQLTRYIEEMQSIFLARGVRLESDDNQRGGR